LTDKNSLEYGVSITDECIDWQTTEDCLNQTAQKLSDKNRNDLVLKNGVTF